MYRYAVEGGGEGGGDKNNKDNSKKIINTKIPQCKRPRPRSQKDVELFVKKIQID